MLQPRDICSLTCRALLIIISASFCNPFMHAINPLIGREIMTCPFQTAGIFHCFQGVDIWFAIILTTQSRVKLIQIVLLSFLPHIIPVHPSLSGSGSSVGIVIDYGLDGRVSKPGGDAIFRPSIPALGPTQPPVQWVLGLSQG